MGMEGWVRNAGAYYDKGYKRMLSKRKNFLHFLQKYIRLGWVDGIREEDLQLIDKSFIDDDFKERESDIVYRVRTGDLDVVFYSNPQK